MRGGRRYTVKLEGIDLEIMYVRSSSEASSGLNLVNAKTGNRVRYKKVDEQTGEEVSDIVSGKVVGDKMIVFSDAELNGAFADRDKFSSAVVEDVADIPAERVKSHYNCEATNKDMWNIIGGRMKEGHKQLRFNFVEGRQVREAILRIEGDRLVMYVLFFPSEVRDGIAVPSPECPEKLASKVDNLFAKLAETKLPVAENVRDKVIEELIARKLTGESEMVAVEVVPKGKKKVEQDVERLLASY